MAQSTGELHIAGIDKLKATIARISQFASVTAICGAKPTTGQVKRGSVKKGTQRMVDVSRSAGKNVTIIRAQAKGVVGRISGKKYPPRNVIFTSAEEKRRGIAIWQAAFDRFSRGQTGLEGLDVAARWVAQLLVNFIKNHIHQQIGKGGSKLHPVLPATQQQKDREVRPGLPTLQHTGQLLESLIPYARRGR